MAKKNVKAKKMKKSGSSKIKKESLETPVEKQIERFGKEVAEGVEEVEQWMIERKKFLIKLAWVIGFISVLLIVSHFYLRVKGFG